MVGEILPYFHGMRAKKHITKFGWSERVDLAKAKYHNKWIVGPKGMLWIFSVYPEGGSLDVACTVCVNEKRTGRSFKMLVSEIEREYNLIEQEHP